jgi:hypothetical protein
MMIRYILTLGLLASAFYALAQRGKAKFLSVAFMVCAVVGIYFTWVPQHATRVAEAMGVGRGVDLIIYIWVVISLLVSFHLHLKVREHTKTITELARRIALSSPLNPADRQPIPQADAAPEGTWPPESEG